MNEALGPQLCPHPENGACLSSIQGHRKDITWITSHLYVTHVIFIRDLLLKGVFVSYD